MNIYNPIFSKAAVFAVLSLSNAAAHAAQNDEPPRSVAQSAVAEAARARLEQGGSLAEQIARAKGKSEEVQAMMRDRAVGLASSSANRNAQQLRAGLPGNTQVSQSEAKSCDTPVHPTQDNPSLCKPGSND
jgi:hypothetical protein